MASDNQPNRVLALDIRSNRFGFVVFEGPKQLLDWGVKSCTTGKSGLSRVAKRRIVGLLNMYAPVVVLSYAQIGHSKRSNRAFGIIIRALRKEIALRSWPLRFISRQKVKLWFRHLGFNNKHEVAFTLAKQYSDLAWKLPPKRKPWKSEDQRMCIFGAAALGITFLSEYFSWEIPRQSEIVKSAIKP